MCLVIITEVDIFYYSLTVCLMWRKIIKHASAYKYFENHVFIILKKLFMFCSNKTLELIYFKIITFHRLPDIEEYLLISGSCRRIRPRSSDDQQTL